MIDIIIGFFIALFFFLLGSTTQAWKKFVGVITKVFCKIFNIKLDKNEKISQEFKNTYKDIKTVKKSNIGLKKVRSINITALIIWLISITLIIVNLDVISGNIITNWLFTFLEPLKIFAKGAIDLNTTYTAIMFTLFSFSASKLISQWKVTKAMRKEKRINKAKELALKNMSSTELVEEAKKKDKININKVGK